jgi:chaperone modulatory protein CbpM
MNPSEDCVWLDASVTVERSELARMCGISLVELQELVDYGSLPVADGGAFSTDIVPALREAVRLRGLFDLDLFTAGLLAHYLQRIEHLERQLRSLRTQETAHVASREGPGTWREPHA